MGALKKARMLGAQIVSRWWASITPKKKYDRIVSYKFKTCVGRDGQGKQVFRVQGQPQLSSKRQTALSSLRSPS